MFGEIEADDNHVLRYSLLYDFFQCFSDVTLYGLPIAQCLAPHFLVHIQSFVDYNRSDTATINKLRIKHSFFTMGDITEKLVSIERIKPVTLKKSKTSLLLSDGYERFASEHLKEYDVTLYTTKYEKKLIQSTPRLSYYMLQSEINAIRGNQKMRKQEAQLAEDLKKQLAKCSTHYYFKKKAFQTWLFATYKKSILWIYVLEKLILRAKPSLIVVSSEASIYGTVLSLLSKKYQITLVNIPLVAIGDRTLIPARANYYFAWGPFQKQWLLERNIKENMIVETGNLYFYYQQAKPTCTKAMFYRTLNIPTNHRIITFTTQPLPQANRKIEQWVKNVSTLLPVTFIIKKHRSDRHDYSLIKDEKNVRILKSDYPLYTALHYSDCVMTVASTTGFEAVLLGKPLLILQPSIPYHHVLNSNDSMAFFVKTRAGERIKNDTQMKEVVKKIVASNEYVEELKERGRKFIEQTILTVDDAPLLVKKHIEDILSK
ncbi:hypothetical protein [Bacillus sp. CGMCC 1.16541]|uniref:capsular polysaccharide export protein, LipB/KpsS family n=1 Tax=Bacillus sp. CGMCC 1.16541 TaxID=2185143 RepID=UPI000D72C5AE|nr:hypothetical protein [Bacillus sp. CGMCC 1.16541]